MPEYAETIDTVARLREVIPPADGVAAHKDIDHLDDVCRRYIALSPFVLVATRGADGLLDVSPKGDPAGFVHVLDERTLAIPDRPGNHRLDTLENVLAHPEVALLFLIPGKGDTLRVSGTGRVVRGGPLARQLAYKGREPELILLLDVREAFTHCAKCVVRSGLWEPQRWPDLEGAPSLTEAVLAHAQPAMTNDEVDTLIEDDTRNNLY